MLDERIPPHKVGSLWGCQAVLGSNRIDNEEKGIRIKARVLEQFYWFEELKFRIRQVLGGIKDMNRTLNQ